MTIVESSVVVTQKGAQDHDLRAYAEFLLDGVDLAWAFGDGPALASLQAQVAGDRVAGDRVAGERVASS